MSVMFRIYDADNNEVSFNQDEATQKGIKDDDLMEIGNEKSAGGQLRQQIRPGKRYTQNYMMVLIESKYIDFINLITNNANDYYIEYTTAPTLLTNDSEVSTTNNFKIIIQKGVPKYTAGKDIVYAFNLTIMSVNLL